MISRTKTNFWLDTVIFAAFFITAITGLLLWLVIPGGSGAGETFFLGLTRHTWVEWHSWVGLSVLLGVVIHLAWHWQWLGCVAQRFLKKMTGQTRLNFALDNLLFVAFFLVSLSGLVLWLALPGGGHRGGRNPFFQADLLGLTRHHWSDLHLWAGIVMTVILTVHLTLHWNWIVCVARRYTQVALCRSQECTNSLG